MYPMCVPENQELIQLRHSLGWLNIGSQPTSVVDWSKRILAGPHYLRGLGLGPLKVSLLKTVSFNGT